MERFAPSGIKQFELVAKTQWLYQKPSSYYLICSSNLWQLWVGRQKRGYLELDRDENFWMVEIKING